MSEGGEKRCPLCTEEMDLTDQQLKPCRCGYEICVWCWNHIMDMAERDSTEGRCPACRVPYDKEKIVSTDCGSLVAQVNSGRKVKSQKVKPKSNEGRKHLTDVRVIQRNLAYVMGLPSNLADEDVLGRREYFGQYGKVVKVSLSRTATGAIQHFPNDTCCVYVTYSKEEEVVRCIQSVHGYTLEGKSLRACYGTTKYCHTWLRNMPCNNPDCLYLHDIGSPEDSFSKDEIVTAYTRSKVLQISGATNNLQRSSGNVLPPPVDDFSISRTACGKPISRSPSSNLVNQVKGSSPDDSSGRSTLPAGASWGLRVSNGQPPSATSACSNGSAKQNPVGNNGLSGFSGFSCDAASTNQASNLHNDGRNKSSVNEGGHVLHSNGELKVLGYSKKYIVKDCQATKADTPEGVVRDSFRATVISRDCSSCSSASNEDDGYINMPHEVACSVKRSEQSSSRDGNAAVNRNIQNLCSGLSSIGIGSHIGSERSDATEPGDSFSSHSLLISSGYKTLQHCPPEHARESLTLASSRNIATPDGLYDSRGQSDWVSESRTEEVRETSCGVGEASVAFGEKGLGVSEINHPSHLLHTSNSLNNSNQSVGQFWQNAIVCDTSDLHSRYSAKAHEEIDDHFLPYTSKEPVLSNGYHVNNVSSSAELMNFKLSSLSNLERGRYSGGIDADAADLESSTAVDMGESSIISNILSMDFDACDESLASPLNLAKLLSDRDKQLNSFEITNSRKVQSSNQSRFSFARQEDSASEVTDFGSSFCKIGYKTNGRPVPQDSRQTQDSYLDEFWNGFSSKEDSRTVSSSNSIISNKLSVSRAQVSAPPGFSAQSKPPPPGFSTQERIGQAFDVTRANHLLGSSPLTRNQYHVHPTSDRGSIEDVEFIDPAILAVGRGRLPNGINESGIDTRSDFRSQVGASENDPRLQFLMQQSILGQQTLGYSDDVSPHIDAYSIPSKHMEQSLFGQQSVQPRNAHILNGWEGWSETRNGNDLGVAELLRNEKLGFNRYCPGYENLNFQTSSLYNRAFGM